jgi:hypothetical protein
MAGCSRSANIDRMFVGHVGVALGLHRAERRVHPAALIAGAMLLDLLLWVFVLAGWEQIELPTDYSRHHYLMFVFPYSHGLLATLLWAGLAWGIVVAGLRSWRSARWRIAGVMALAVLSHWALDALVHVRGLPIAGDTSPRIGFGLWDKTLAAGLVESAITVAGCWYFFRGLLVRRAWAIALVVVVALLLTMTVAGETVGGAPPSMRSLAAASLVSNLVVVLVCGWVAAKTPEDRPDVRPANERGRQTGSARGLHARTPVRDTRERGSGG